MSVGKLAMASASNQHSWGRLSPAPQNMADYRKKLRCSIDLFCEWVKKTVWRIWHLHPSGTLFALVLLDMRFL